MAAKAKTVYLAGPEVFLPDAVTRGAVKKELCAARGLRGLFPFDNEVDETGSEALDRIIYRANAQMIRNADFAIFNLTPFRGPSADVGTVFELGMATGLGKPCFAYTNVASSLLERVRAADDRTHRDATGRWVDSAGMSIENFGNADNLMIDCALKESGTTLVRIDVPARAVFHDVVGFSACLDAIEAHMAGEARGLRASA